MEVSLATLAEIVDGTVVGDTSCVISNVGDLRTAVTGEITFLSNDKFANLLPTTNASAVILRESVLNNCNVNAIVVDDPYFAYAKIATYLSKPSSLPIGVHPSATINENALVDETAYIGPNVVIEEQVSIGKHARILANSFIGANSVIGESVVINANVSIYSDTLIGDRTIIHCGAVIGSDGFGYAPHQGEWVKIPQLGRVLLGCDVEIGANSAIDRGALGDTVLHDGVKIDNIVHIAHNVEIGENSALAACVGIAGSTKIGAGCTVGGGAKITGHIEIADNVHLGGMAMVTKSLPIAGAYASGLPAEPSAQWRKNVVRFRQLEKMDKRIKSLEKELKALKGS